MDRAQLDSFARCYGSVSSPQDKQDCRERVREAGYRYLGGSTRDAFMAPSGDRVVKLEVRGLFNGREIRMSSEGIDALVPVLDHGSGGRWLVMPRVETRGFNEIPWSDVKQVKRAIRDAGWECRDIRRPNIGYMDGRPVAFDYAEQCKKNGGGLL